MLLDYFVDYGPFTLKELRFKSGPKDQNIFWCYTNMLTR